VKTLAIGLVTTVLVVVRAAADEVPIAGTVKAVDQTAQTLTVEAASKGQPRVVVIEVRPTSRIVRFARSTEAGKTGFVEKSATLADLKPGWTVSVTTKHDGDREVAEVVRVVFER
jgi:hypothetical protein